MNLSTFERLDLNESTIGRSYSPALLGYIFAEVFLILSITFGNILVLVAFSKYQELQNSMNVYVVCLALADLTIGLIVLPAHLTVFIFPIINSTYFYCMFRLCLIMGSWGASAFTLAIIAVDRDMVIERPLTYNTFMTTRKAKLICIGVWVFTYSYSFSPLFGWNEWSPGKYCLFIQVLPSKYITFNVLFLIACMMCVGVVNFKTFITANRVSHAIQTQTAAAADGTRNGIVKNMRAVKTLALMFSLFLLCVLPFGIYILWEAYSVDRGNISNDLPRTVLGMLTFFNSALNPIIYNKRIPEFNRAFRKLLRMKPQIEPTSTT